MDESERLPPRTARRIILTAFPASSRWGVVDELDDEFRRFIAPHRSLARARAWYWRQALLSLPSAVAMRLRTLRRVPADVRGAFRVFAARPGFAVAAIFVLALGIGASSAVLSAVDGILLRPLPYAAPDRLVTILYKGYNPVSPANFLDWKQRSQAFDAMAAAEYWTPNMTGIDQPEKVTALRVTADVWPVLGISPLLGHVWTAADEQDAVPPVLLSYGLWQRRFGADMSVPGRTVLLNGQPCRVIGVMPASFTFSPFWAAGELWAPLDLRARAGNRGGGSLRVFARRRDGVSLEQARADMAAVTARLEQELPGSNRDMRVTDLTEQVVGDVRTPLLILLAAVGCVLLIVCANVAHMLLAHAMSRDREMAVRAALGASGGRLAQQLLTESLVLAAVGGVLGLVIARGGVQLLLTLAASSLPRTGAVSVDSRALVATIAVTGLTGLLFGIVPARRAASRELNDALRHGGRSATEGRGPRQTRRLLIASQFALALMLLVGAGLLIRSFLSLQSRDPGFDPRNLLTAEVSVTGTASSPPGGREAFYRAVLSDVRRLPGVASVSAVNHLPIGGDSWGWPFRVEGAAEPAPGETPVASYKVAWPGYFATMGIPLLAGRDVTDTDRLGAPGVVVVNRYLAEHYWPGESAIGKRVAFERDSARRLIWLTVIGVVGNTIHGRWISPPEEEAYLPFLQQREHLENPTSQYAYISLAIRTSCTAETSRSCDAETLVPSVRAIVRAHDPDVPLSAVRTMDEIVAQATARQRFYFVLLGTFAAVALVLAAAGIYGVMSYLMARRVREIGVRMALGARPVTLRWRMTAEGLRLAALGGVVGLVAAVAASRTMSALLFGVTPMDIPAFAAGVVVLGLAALLACYIPARRATRIDPLDALRSE